MPHSASPLRSIAFFFVLLTNTAAIAQDSGDADSEYMYFADQYARCAAFFAIATEAMASLGDHKTALTYQEYRYGASMYSLFLALQGRDEEIAWEVAVSLIAPHEKQMLEVMDGKNENIAILIDRHARHCIDIVQEPPQIVQDLGPF